MTKKTPSDFVDGERLWSRHMELARFSRREDEGVDRPALSPIESKARAQIISWGRGAGLIAYTDGIANLFLRYEGRDPSLAPVVAGSHIDSQPTGGRFDGVSGVLAALESVEAMIALGQRPQRPLEIVAWTNEEGSRFAPGMTGSEVFVGAKKLEQVRMVRDADGITIGEAVDQVLDRDRDVPLREFARPMSAFIELHIEQGPVLERVGIPVGIVTGIQGTRRYRVRVTGEAAHAGTALRAERRDALMAAIRVIGAIDAVALTPEDAKLTVGMFNVTPNAPSVVPAEVYFSIDLRHPDNAVVDRIDAEIRRIVETQRGRCHAELVQIAHAPSLDFNPAVRDAIAYAASALGIPSTNIYSAAGHDARQLHYFCPSGMIFIPCRDGISHNPKEWTDPASLVSGTKVLADVMWSLANAE